MRNAYPAPGSSSGRRAPYAAPTDRSSSLRSPNGNPYFSAKALFSAGVSKLIP
jgi:hypothetical protein